MNYVHTDMEDLIQAVIESATQAEHDFCGDQRAFHLPRLQKAMKLLMSMFPQNAVAAMGKATDAWGDPLVK